MTEDTLREEFITHPELAGDFGYCNELFAKKIADWFLSKRREERELLVKWCEGMKKPVRHFSNTDYTRDVEVMATGGHKCNENCKPDIDEEGYNTALDDLSAHLRGTI